MKIINRCIIQSPCKRCKGEGSIPWQHNVTGQMAIGKCPTCNGRGFTELEYIAPPDERIKEEPSEESK